MTKAGLEDVVAAESSICDVNGTEGRLIYEGYDIADLADHATFEEVVFLLWFGHLPNKTELENISKELRVNRTLPDELIKFMKEFPKQAQPMEVLRTCVSMLSMWDPDAHNNDPDATLRKATRLTAQVPTIVAAWNSIRNGKKIIAPREDCNFASDFLYMLSGKMPDEVSAKSLDIALVLHADHELNASTFAARVAAATLTDMHAAITAAIGTLAGPLHGGANQEVIKMLLEIGEIENVEPYIRKAFDDHKKIMGFGHRVYKTEDPRAHHLRQMSEEMGKRLGQLKWYQMSRKIEDMVLKEKKLYPNVDFYSASIYYMLGIPTDLYTPIFACSRMAGWAAHIMEQYTHNRLIRPRAEYTGPRNLKYTPISTR